jgi:hypothetical protein
VKKIARWILAVMGLMGLGLTAFGEPPGRSVVAVFEDEAFEVRQAAEAQWYYAYYWYKLDRLDAAPRDFAYLDAFAWELEADLVATADVAREWLDFESASLHIESLRTERLSEWYGTTDAVKLANVKPNDTDHKPGLSGKPRPIPEKGTDHDKYSAKREAEIAKILSEVLNVEQQPDTKKDPEPYNTANADLRVNGELAEIYTPSKTNNDGKAIQDAGIMSNILDNITDKSKTQAGIVIVDLSDFSEDFILAFLDKFINQAENPKKNNDRFAMLKELWIVDDKGVIQRVWPKPTERIAPPNK